MLSARPAGCRHLLAITNRRDITHRDTNHLAVITDAGKPLADAEFPTSPAGYEHAIRWARSFGTVAIAGVEGTSSYGAGLTRVLQAAGIEVAEVSRRGPHAAARANPTHWRPMPRRAPHWPATAWPCQRRTHDRLAGAAGRPAQRGQGTHRRDQPNPRPDGHRPGRAARTLPPPQHHRCGQSIGAMPARQPQRPHHRRSLDGCKALAQCAGFLERQKQDLTAQLDVLVLQINPALRAAYGVGPDTAAQLLVTAGTNPHRVRNEASLAALCGVAPVPASSGKITRHRLSRGGDRAANNALYRIALVRMSAHQQTRDYVARQHGNGRTKRRFCGCSKRAIAREIFRLLTRPAPIDDRRAGDRAGNAAVAEPSTSRLCSGQARRLRACDHIIARGGRGFIHSGAQHAMIGAS